MMLRMLTVHRHVPCLTTAAPLALLAGATALLLALQAAPREDLPVLLVFGPGQGAEQALGRVLAVPGWDPIAVRRLGPLTLALAAPSLPRLSAGALRQASGAWLATSAPGSAPCGARLG